MDSLEQQTMTSRDIPRFDDRMVNIWELIRIMAESLVNEIMDAQAASPVGSAAPAPSYDGTAEEHAKRIIDVVVADNPIERRAA